MLTVDHLPDQRPTRCQSQRDESGRGLPGVAQVAAIPTPLSPATTPGTVLDGRCPTAHPPACCTVSTTARARPRPDGSGGRPSTSPACRSGVGRSGSDRTSPAAHRTAPCIGRGAGCSAPRRSADVGGAGTNRRTGCDHEPARSNSGSRGGRPSVVNGHRARRSTSRRHQLATRPRTTRPPARADWWSTTRAL